MPWSRPTLGCVPRADGILPDLALTRPVLDRRGDLRADPALLPRLLADPATRVLHLVGDRVRVETAPGGSVPDPGQDDEDD